MYADSATCLCVVLSALDIAVPFVMRGIIHPDANWTEWLFDLPDDTPYGINIP